MLDCGAYTGDTLEQFDKITTGRFKKVYSFEPDQRNFTMLREVAKSISSEKIVPINAGVYRKSGKLRFAETGNIDTHISEDEDATMLPVVSIDEFVIGKEAPTFIKMDIEGGEVDALEGGRNTISNYKPKLAIAVYHKAEDLWDIPLLIQQMNPKYKLYLRHYTDGLVDTVCYAI
jgi:FkbM family methyltransferase